MELIEYKFDDSIKHFDITPVVISGTKKERVNQWSNVGTQYVIANYDLLRLKIKGLVSIWSSSRFLYPINLPP